MSGQAVMDLRSSLQKLRCYVENENFRGYDPYDALNSPVLRLLTFKSKSLRIAFIQALKRSPLNFRSPLLIRKGYNPKGIGLFMWGYAKSYKKEGRTEYLKKTAHLIDLLEELKSKGYAGNSWGYNFDWQSRAFFVPRFTPTIVNSSFVGHALIDVYNYTGNEHALDMAISIKDFILNDLNRTEEADAFSFSYTPLDHTAVHNANLLGASLLIRLYRFAQQRSLKEAALSSLAYSMKHQKEDGSWNYAETSFQQWIDSFHTGFNLQSILYFLEEGFGEEYRPQFERGVRFYSENFFLEDGTPKYYHDRVFPIDIHSSAQGAVFFSRLGSAYADLAGIIVQWMVRNLQDKDGYFYFQRKKHYTNKIPYMRWSQAWAFHALTEFVLLRGEVG